MPSGVLCEPLPPPIFSQENYGRWVLYSTTNRSGITVAQSGCSSPASNINRPKGLKCHDTKNFPVCLVVADVAVSHPFCGVGNLSSSVDITRNSPWLEWDKPRSFSFTRWFFWRCWRLYQVLCSRKSVLSRCLRMRAQKNTAMGGNVTWVIEQLTKSV
jgi:hypothetical protein